MKRMRWNVENDHVLSLNPLLILVITILYKFFYFFIIYFIKIYSRYESIEMRIGIHGFFHGICKYLEV